MGLDWLVLGGLGAVQQVVGAGDVLLAVVVG